MYVILRPVHSEHFDRYLFGTIPRSLNSRARIGFVAACGSQ